MYKLYNEDCFKTMQSMIEENKKVDLILTSPPYNTSKVSHTNKSKALKNHTCRYDYYEENKSLDEYNKWTIDLFNYYDKVLNKDGCILYNISYGNENNEQMYLALANIINKTNFTIADTIIWKKKSALPNNTSSNKLTRICEFVFVICRKTEYKTFKTNKRVVSHNKNQVYYENIFNFIEAKNNDGSNDLNKATYSSELCEKLLKLYAKDKALVYDSFNGTGTTGVACIRLNLDYIGSEISEKQCKYSQDRLLNEWEKGALWYE